MTSPLPRGGKSLIMPRHISSCLTVHEASASPRMVVALWSVGTTSRIDVTRLAGRAGDGKADSSSRGWTVGDAGLVWWCKAWSPGSVREIDRVSQGPYAEEFRLRFRFHGRDRFSDVWIGEHEWEARLRPLVVLAAGAGRLTSGSIARSGEMVRDPLSGPLHDWVPKSVSLPPRCSLSNGHYHRLIDRLTDRHR